MLDGGVVDVGADTYRLYGPHWYMGYPFVSADAWRLLRVSSSAIS